MEQKRTLDVEIFADLLEAIEAFPLHREVLHCGENFQVSPFALYADCPRCGTRFKIRSFAAVSELEDVFDAVFAWMGRPGAEELVRRRRETMQQDEG
jgi:hypothetical protein